MVKAGRAEAHEDLLDVVTIAIVLWKEDGDGSKPLLTESHGTHRECGRRWQGPAIPR